MNILNENSGYSKDNKKSDKYLKKSKETEKNIFFKKCFRNDGNAIKKIGNFKSDFNIENNSYYGIVINNSIGNNFYYNLMQNDDLKKKNILNSNLHNKKYGKKI